MPAIKEKIDAYIRLERMLETTSTGSVKQRRLEYELSKLEAIDESQPTMLSRESKN